MSTIVSIVSRALAARRHPAGEPDVHFHGGSGGVYVCEHAGCDSPALDPADR